MQTLKEYAPLLSVIFHFGSLLFCAGIWFATTKFHGRQIKETKHTVERHEEKLQEHGRDIEGLKVHTGYPAVH